ncbi:hypothetical protein [Actinomadura sp. DC4]|uniref:hypothetical protein n=1 Tax=Actinomadura sp. DC4 TaxID=3055069 RepID=UPI0025B04289|nr:hypothetical protein [Actinomadura sp. DC4]MDN3353494.1 hypothetical protein [Actinomadura sp. DC4]
MEEWGDFAVITGGAAAALLGLLFVAISIKVDVIGRSITLRARATQTMVLFLMAFLAAAVLGIPAQPLWVFGLLMTVLGLLAAFVLVAMERKAERANDGRSLGTILSAVTPSALTCFLVLATGVSALAGWRGGIYFLAAAIILAVTGGVINAWLFLVRLDT